MRVDKEWSRLTGSNARFHLHSSNWLSKAVALAMSAVLLVLAFMLSVLVFTVLAMGGLLVWGYLWWRTRGLRKQMRERPSGGHVIEGTVIREPATVGQSHREERDADPKLASKD